MGNWRNCKWNGNAADDTGMFDVFLMPDRTTEIRVPYDGLKTMDQAMKEAFLRWKNGRR